MLFRVLIHTLKLCRSHYYSECETVSCMLSSKACVACEVERRIFYPNSWVFGKYVFVYIRRERNIACEEYGHLPSFLAARKESLVVKSEERQLYSQSGKVK